MCRTHKLAKKEKIKERKNKIWIEGRLAHSWTSQGHKCQDAAWRHIDVGVMMENHETIGGTINWMFQNTLQCVAVCCYSTLQCVAVCCSTLSFTCVLLTIVEIVAVCCCVLQCVAVCCSVLQCVAVCCNVLQCVAARWVSFVFCWPALEWLNEVQSECFDIAANIVFAVFCSMVQYVVVCCSVLQCVAVCCSVLQHAVFLQAPHPAA